MCYPCDPFQLVVHDKHEDHQDEDVHQAIAGILHTIILNLQIPTLNKN